MARSRECVVDGHSRSLIASGCHYARAGREERSSSRRYHGRVV